MEKKVAKLFKEADTNNDNQIDLEEFKVLLNKVDSTVKNLPATAQVASQQGKYLGKVFNALAAGDKAHPFFYHHRGSLAYVGHNEAVFDADKWRLTGFATWWLWRSIYLSQQHSFRNKVYVSIDWTKSMLFGRDTSRF